MFLVIEDVPSKKPCEYPSLNGVTSQAFDLSNLDRRFKRDKMEVRKYLSSFERSPEWLNAASVKLNVLLKDLETLTKHSHFQVRKELACGISKLLVPSSRLATFLFYKPRKG